jgi:hypothetical protein
MAACCSKRISAPDENQPVVADINNDGSKEIIQITNNGTIYIMTSNGTNLAGTPYSINTAVECSPVVAYMDGGSQAGIIFGDAAGKLHSVRADGTESPNFRLPLEETSRFLQPLPTWMEMAISRS